MGIAVVINRHASLVSVEEPSLGTGKTHLVLPVPTGTANVSGVSVVELREQTGTILEVVTAVTSEAVSVGARRGALVRDWHTDLISVEEPVL